MKHEEDVKYLIPLSYGDHGAFGFLYAKYRTPLMRFTLRYVRSETVAHDIVQDVFLSVWKSRERFSTIKLFHSYIYCAARNIAVDYLRGMTMRQRYVANMPAAALSEWMVEEQYSAQETARIVRAQVLKMPPQRCRVFALSRIEGMNRKEIARDLHLSPKTVANHLHLALQEIRHAIDAM